MITLLLVAALASVPPASAPPSPPPVPGAPAAPEPPESLRRYFGSLTDILRDALERTDRAPTLPSSTWSPWEETKSSNERRINDLLDDAAALLSDGEATDARRRIRALEAERDALEATVRDGFERLAVAKPASEREWYEVLGKSKEGWEAAILAARQRQTEIRSEVEALRAAFAANLRSLGLELGEDGADALLTTVAGDRFVDMTVAFGNIRSVTEQLRRITERMNESPETARRYYGMYVLLVRTMDRVQDAYVEHLEKVAIPRLESFGKEAATTEREARTLLRAATDASRPTLEKNVLACELAQEAVGNYVAYLKTQIGRVKELNRTVEERLKVGENTYRTMSVAVGVSELIRQGEVDLAAVLDMELPELRGFDNVALREQYRRLGDRLRAE